MIDKEVYRKVLERASRDGYPECEECGHNGTRYKLEMSHTIPKSQGGQTSLENVKLRCLKCHRENYHGDRIIVEIS